MSKKRSTARLRAVAAYDVLRGRPPKPDYGVLVVMPLIAAAGGALIAMGVDQAVSRRAESRYDSTVPDPQAELAPASN